MYTVDNDHDCATVARLLTLAWCGDHEQSARRWANAVHHAALYARTGERPALIAGPVQS